MSVYAASTVNSDSLHLFICFQLHEFVVQLVMQTASYALQNALLLDVSAASQC
jgi:hypothetical protein